MLYKLRNHLNIYVVVIFILCFGILDHFFTIYSLIAYGIQTEANPLIRAMYSLDHGFAYVSLFKLSVVAIVIGFCYFISVIGFKKIANWFIILCALWGILLSLNNLIVIITF